MCCHISCPSNMGFARPDPGLWEMANCMAFPREYIIVPLYLLWASVIREFKLRVICKTANARQRKILRYQAVKSKLTWCFKTEIHNYSFDARKKI